MNTKNRKTKSEAAKFLESLTGGPLTFGALLESERLSEELTMAEFAAKLKISVSHLNDIEKGRKFVSPERAAQFARRLGYSEKQYVRIALQDILNHAGLKRFRIDVKEAA